MDGTSGRLGPAVRLHVSSPGDCSATATCVDPAVEWWPFAQPRSNIAAKAIAWRFAPVASQRLFELLKMPFRRS